MRKLRSKKGETITETLVAIILIALVFVFLASAVATAAKVNETFRQDDVTFRIDGTPEDRGTINVNIEYTENGSDQVIGLSAEKYHVESGNREEGYDYYEYQTSVPTP